MTDRDPRRRPSRRGWPLRTQPATTSAGTHAHGLPRWLLPTLIAFGVALLTLVGVLFVMVQRQTDFTRFRDQQQQQVREDMRQGFCDLLDQLPASAVLDGPRKRYGCGPGIPASQLPPAVRQGWTPPATAPAPTPASPQGASRTRVPAPTAPPTPNAVAGPLVPTPAVPSARPSPSPAPPPSPTPAPPPDLLCRLLTVCAVEVP